MASGWVKNEYNHAVALASSKRLEPALQLIPVLLRTAELPGFRPHLGIRIRDVAQLYGLTFVP